MTKKHKTRNHLSCAAVRKLNRIGDLLSEGEPYYSLGGRKLHMPAGNTKWITFRLSYSERAIIALDRCGTRLLLFAGSHEDYNKLVGPKKSQRLQCSFC